MRGFYDDQNEYEEYENDDMENFSEDSDLIDFNLAVLGFNCKVFEMTVKLVKSSWFWRFKSLESKLNIIEDTYKKISNLIIKEE
jgi:hypothetical protein